MSVSGGGACVLGCDASICLNCVGKRLECKAVRDTVIFFSFHGVSVLFRYVAYHVCLVRNRRDTTAE